MTTPTTTSDPNKWPTHDPFDKSFIVHAYIDQTNGSKKYDTFEQTLNFEKLEENATEVTVCDEFRPDMVK